MNNQYNLLGLATKLKVIGDSINAQLKKIFKSQQIEYEPRWFSTLNLLSANREMSIQQISRTLGVTHPAVIQILNELIKRGYVRTVKGTNDKRTTYPVITEEGKRMYLMIKPLVDKIEKTFFSLSSATGYDIVDVLSKLENALSSRKIYDKVTELIKEDQMREVKIISFEKKYKSEFKKLNIEWLQEYFAVEPADEKILNYPENEIIQKGGEIFLALSNNEVVGTCAMIKIDDDNYELAKMAVTKSAQRKQVGRKLCLTAIGFAVDSKAKRIVLDTNEKLSAAIGLYRKLGFVIVPHNYDNKYKRDLFRMELNLEELIK